jgi:flap endonuclease-1
MIFSEDGDMLTFGGTKLCKGMGKFIYNNSKVEIVDLSILLKKTKLTMSQFQNVCVLLGCDYCDKLSSPVAVYNDVRTSKNLKESIKKIIKRRTEHNKKYEKNGKGKLLCIPKKSDIKCIMKAKQYFRNASDDLDNNDNFIITTNNIQLRKIQYEHFMDFMCDNHNFNKVTIKNETDMLVNVYKRMNIKRKNNSKVYTLSENSKSYIMDNDNYVMETESESDDMPNKNSGKKKYIKS